MFLLGHIGITVGIVWAAEYKVKKIYRGSEKSSLLPVDYCLVALGSMLPDIIDKPLGHLILKDSLNNGRIFCHTLLFVLLLSIAALAALRSGRNWGVPVCFGSLIHLALDQMWKTPATLFWPLYGWSFPSLEYDFFKDNFLHLTRPDVYIPELLGGAILLAFLVNLKLREPRPGYD